MVEIQADQRSIDAAQEPAAESRVIRGLAELRELQIGLARDLARIDASCHFVHAGCASVVEYAMKLGFSALEARTLTNLGKTLAAAPEVEAQVRDARITVEAASAIGRVLAHPELVRAGDDWVRKAAAESLRALQARVKQRLELHAQGDPGIVEVRVFVTSRARDRFRRAREVASDKARKALTAGQTFKRVVDFYLEKLLPRGERPASSSGRLAPPRRYELDSRQPLRSRRRPPRRSSTLRCFMRGGGLREPPGAGVCPSHAPPGGKRPGGRGSWTPLPPPPHPVRRGADRLASSTARSTSAGCNGTP